VQLCDNLLGVVGQARLGEQLIAAHDGLLIEAA
jgi:hypothetical protein